MSEHRPSYQELRLDGQTYDLSSNLFFMADHDGRVYRGNGQRLMDTPLGPEAAERLRTLFASFEAQLSRPSAKGLRDAETRRALEARGYVR